MPFDEVELGEIALAGDAGLVDGPFGSNLPASDYVPHGVPVIRGSNLSKGEVRFKGEDFVFVSDATVDRLNRSTCIPRDIIFTKKGTLGQVGIVPPRPYEKYLLSSNQMRLRVNEAIANSDYVYYALSTYDSISKIIREAEHTGVPKINLAYIRRFRIPLPPRSAQDQICGIISALDNRIDVLRQTNATLESIAQALFKSWFIDFDPVRVKAEGREPEGMDAATTALFPAEFEESALGLIPKGWTYRSAEELFDVGIGKTPPRKEPQWFSEDNGDVRWLSIKDMGDEGTIATRSSEFLSDEAVAKFNVRVVPTHTVLMSFKLTVGRLCITDGPMCTNEAIAHFKARKDSPQFTYLYCYLKAFDFRTLGSTSSIADATNSKAVKALPVLVPPKELVTVFHQTVEALFEKMYVQKAHWRRLEELRDSLLPRLISGKLRLPEAQAQLEEAIA